MGSFICLSLSLSHTHAQNTQSRTKSQSSKTLTGTCFFFTSPICHSPFTHSVTFLYTDIQDTGMKAKRDNVPSWRIWILVYIRESCKSNRVKKFWKFDRHLIGAAQTQSNFIFIAISCAFSQVKVNKAKRLYETRNFSTFNKKNRCTQLVG